MRTLTWGAVCGAAVIVAGTFWYSTPAPEPASPVSGAEVESAELPRFTLTLVGDMMFDRYIRTKHQETGYHTVLKSDIRELLGKADVLVGNLEGPITDFSPVAQYGENNAHHFQFTFDRSVADFLLDAGFDAVSLGNNHASNFGTEGLRDTKRYLEDAELGYFGSPDEPEHIWTLEKSGVTLAFLAENEFDDVAPADTERLIRALDRTYDHVMVFAHWGDEYETFPHERQKERARAYLRAGADLIIGAHPHVIQTKEVYDGAWIYYSLGNFIFDQYFTEEVRCGAIVTFEVTKEQITPITEQFSYLEKDGTTSLSNCRTGIPTAETAPQA